MNKLFAVCALMAMGSGLAQAQPRVGNQPIRVPSGTPNVGTPNLEVSNKTIKLDADTRLDKLDLVIKDLLKQNATLQARVNELETKQAQDDKDKVSIKLMISGLDKAAANQIKSSNELKAQMAEHDKLFQNHYHKAGYSYETLDFLLDTPKSNKGNFYIPYVWLGSSAKELPKYEKIDGVKQKLGNTTKQMQAAK